jgi:hypothetical protein
VASERAGTERAETYLRLLAEAALRLARPQAASRVHRATSTLLNAGVVTDAQAAWILFDLSMALRARGRAAPVWPGQRMRRLTGFLPGQPPVPPGDWQVVQAPGPAPGASFMTLVVTADRVLIPATLWFPPAADTRGADAAPWAGLSATDDAGTSYQLKFAGGAWAGSAWTGTIMMHPAPPPGARHLKFVSPNGPLCLARLPPPAPGHGTGQLAAEPARRSPGERLLIRHAEALLAALPAGVTRVLDPEVLDIGELIATLEGAGALSALSPVTAQVSALYQLLGVSAEDTCATTEVPARWLEVATHYGRRKHLPPASGTAAIGVALPELDGARFAVAGVRSGRAGSFLHVVARGLRAMPHRPPPGPEQDSGFSWWVLDDAGGWHLGSIDEVSLTGGDMVVRLALMPPLGHATATLTVEVAGTSQQVTASLPVRW